MKRADHTPADAETSSSAAKRRKRFLRVAARRTTEVLRSMDSLEMCANRNAYLFGDADIAKIFDALEGKMLMLRQRFNKTPRPPEFTL
jgi:hypothetical protein